MKEESLITKIIKRKDLVLLGVIAILLLFIFRQCESNSNLKSKIDIQNSNLVALNDSIRLQKNKAGEATYVIKTLLADKDNLILLNKKLKEELDKQKGKVVYLSNIAAKTKVDTQYVYSYLSAYGNNKFSLDWKYDSIFFPDNYRKFSGNSFFTVDTIKNKVIPGITRINEDEIGFSLVTGLREKNKSLEIFVTPKYPGMKITKIEGAVIDPSKSDVLKSMFPNKRFSVGPYVGIGIGSGISLTGKPRTGIFFNIGMGIQYSLIKF